MNKTFWLLAFFLLIISGCGGVTWFPDTPVATNVDQFTLTPVTGVALSSPQTSNSITVSGIASGSTATINVSGDSTSKYSIGTGEFISIQGTVKTGDTVKVQHTSSSALGSTITTKLSIGNKNADFSSTTVNITAFTIQKTGFANAYVYSGPITLTCITGSYEISIDGGGPGGGAYSVDGAIWYTTKNTFTLNNGQSFYVRNFQGTLSSVTSSIHIGGVVSTFQSSIQ